MGYLLADEEEENLEELPINVLYALTVKRALGL